MGTEKEKNYCPFCDGSGKSGLDMNDNEIECFHCNGSGEGLFAPGGNSE